VFVDVCVARAEVIVTGADFLFGESQIGWIVCQLEVGNFERLRALDGGLLPQATLFQSAADRSVAGLLFGVAAARIVGFANSVGGKDHGNGERVDFGSGGGQRRRRFVSINTQRWSITLGCVSSQPP
jgi:hypothetical protein